MALIKCLECGHMISNKVRTRCPNCGNIRQGEDGIFSVLILQFILFICFLILMAFTKGDGGYIVAFLSLGILWFFHVGKANYKSDFTKKVNYFGYIAIAILFSLITFFN